MPADEKRRRDREVAEIAALADGSLPAARRAALERRVAASPRLQALLREQQAALAAVRARDERAPQRLRESIAAGRAARPSASAHPSPARGGGRRGGRGGSGSRRARAAGLRRGASDPRAGGFGRRRRRAPRSRPRGHGGSSIRTWLARRVARRRLADRPPRRSHGADRLLRQGLATHRLHDPLGRTGARSPAARTPGAAKAGRGTASRRMDAPSWPGIAKATCAWSQRTGWAAAAWSS